MVMGSVRGRGSAPRAASTRERVLGRRVRRPRLPLATQNVKDLEDDAAYDAGSSSESRSAPARGRFRTRDFLSAPP